MAEIKTIITGHGHFATGIKTSLELLSSLPKNYYFVDFEESMTPETLSSKFKDILDTSSQCVFFTDLLGGTPFKEAVNLTVNSSNFEVVAGCNLGSLLETTYSSYDNVKDCANDLVKVAKQGTQIFDFSEEDLDSNDSNYNDGI